MSTKQPLLSETQEKSDETCLTRDLSTPEGRAYWASVEKSAEGVRDWPAWRRVGIDVAQPGVPVEEPKTMSDWKPAWQQEVRNNDELEAAYKAALAEVARLTKERDEAVEALKVTLATPPEANTTGSEGTCSSVPGSAWDVIAQDRDTWKQRAEKAEAEVARLTERLRALIAAYEATEDGRLAAFTRQLQRAVVEQVARAEKAEAEVARLRADIERAVRKLFEMADAGHANIDDVRWTAVWLGSGDARREPAK